MNDADFLKLCACGKAAAIAQALADGANPKAMDEYGETALIKAAESGATESVRLLLAAGAEINAAAENGRTALAAAVAKGQKVHQKYHSCFGRNRSHGRSKTGSQCG